MALLSENTGAPAAPHSVAEDVHALLIGSSFVAVGLSLLNSCGLSTGGLAGAALIVSYVTDWPVGPILVIFNLPFFALAHRRLGKTFAVKSICSMVAVALLSVRLPMWLTTSSVDSGFAAIFGGSLLGIAVLSLARHRASVGGIGIFALYVQERNGLNAGVFQMSLDIVILSVAAFVLEPAQWAWSAVSAVALNLVMIAYHRPGRYAGL